jgi:hypothetical protein
MSDFMVDDPDIVDQQRAVLWSFDFVFPEFVFFRDELAHEALATLLGGVDEQASEVRVMAACIFMKHMSLYAQHGSWVGGTFSRRLSSMPVGRATRRVVPGSAPPFPFGRSDGCLLPRRGDQHLDSAMGRTARRDADPAATRYEHMKMHTPLAAL